MTRSKLVVADVRIPLWITVPATRTKQSPVNAVADRLRGLVGTIARTKASTAQAGLRMVIAQATLITC